MNPLIYTLTFDDMQEAYRGFTHKGRNYPGVANIVEDLKWAKDTDTWNISKSRYELKGVVNIKQ
jgi:DNA polymerase/3'-5' exonuclease PolX